jgi:hypothetical protein
MQGDHDPLLPCRTSGVDPVSSQHDVWFSRAVPKFGLNNSDGENRYLLPRVSLRSWCKCSGTEFHGPRTKLLELLKR